MTQWFYILTGDDVSSQQALWVDPNTDPGTNGSELDNASIYMMEASTSENQYSLQSPYQMWQLAGDGSIVSALNPNYVLGLSGTNAVLVQRSPGDASQQWEFQWVQDSQGLMLGTLRNKGNQQYLTGGNPWSWQPVFTQNMPSDGTPTGMMQWYIQPPSPPTGQLLSIRSVAAGDSPPMVVNIQGASMTPGTTTILYEAQPNSSNIVWTYTLDGYLLSSVNPGLALSLNVNASVGGGSANGVATYPKQPLAAGASFQQWSFIPVDPQAGTYLIVNQQGTLALATSGTSNSDPLQLVTPNPSDQTQLWSVSPTYPLEVLLAQPAMGYPAFTGNEAAAYTYINSQLGLTKLGTELRSQYGNLAAPLAGYQSRVNMIATTVVLQHSPKDKTPPADLPDSDAMVTVAGVLGEELTAAQAVQQLFQQLTMFHAELAIVATNATAAVIADAAIDTQTQQTVKVSSAAIFEGLIYTILSAGSMLPGEGELAKGLGMLLPVVGNLYQTGVNTVSSYQQSKAQNAQKEQDEEIFYDFEGEVAQVQQFLVDSFEAVGDALAAVESAILRDSFKTRTVAAMAALPSGGNSLFWPPEQGVTLIPRIVPGYEIGVLQALLPTKYQIYTGTWIQGSVGSNSDFDNIPPMSAPSYCIWDEEINSSLEASTVYWIASVASNDTGYPGQATMDFLSKSSSVRWFNFYRRLAGWSGFASEEKWLGNNQTILMFRNYTSTTLSIALKANDAEIGDNGPGSTTLTLPPYSYQSAVLFSIKNGDSNKPDAAVTVTTPDGTTVWSATAGSNYCTSIKCPGDYAIYPYNSDNMPHLFSSSVTTGAGGCDIGIALAQS
ncbi:hypothetical protein E9232_001281 [Inquilinus ginsengisoli]|uniref:Ricin B lectin domain-containing protein n=1 Tax=Inquilinus ginsengisoli TaxID=363840 RepID=A0ABU1JJJ2_9PROT|nr:hypothetical protein [Inquilinus ginsengisoli]MDR6288774.1 hypothetical protein [Inquilinus ginsengisoli]